MPNPSLSIADSINQSGKVGSASSATAVTPNDGADLAVNCRALWIGGAGAVNIDTTDGQTVLISGIPAGTMLPIAAKRVRATSTTATLIIALW